MSKESNVETIVDVLQRAKGQQKPKRRIVETQEKKEQKPKPEPKEKSKK